MVALKRHGLRYGFGEFHLDPDRRLLFGSGGQVIPLKPKVFDTLLLFVECAGEMLEKEALMKGVWGSVIVEENSLNQHISTLRRALGETPGENRFIVTVPGRGYRFVAPVTTQPAEVGRAETAESDDKTLRHGAVAPVTAKARPWRRTIFASLAALATLAVAVIAWRSYAPVDRLAQSEKRVAVLPFENMSPDPANHFYAFGIHDEVINQLMKVSGLEVIPRTSVMPYLEHPKPIAEVGRELDVGAVMEGSVQYANDHLWIKLRLIDAATNKPLWQQEYNRKFDDIVAIESDVALNVAQAVGATLSPHEVDALTEVLTLNSHAHELYFLAKDHERRGVLAWPTAIEQYEKAVKEDPHFALAFAELAILSVGVHLSTDPSPKRMERAQEAAKRALELKPELAEGRIAWAEWQFYSPSPDIEQILRDLKAIESKSQKLPEFFALRADVYQSVGRWEDALADRTKAVQLEPRNVPVLLGPTGPLVVLRRYDEAEKLFDHAQELEPNELGMMFHRATLFLYRDGDPTELRKFEKKMLSGEWVNALIALAAEYDGDYETALKLLETTRKSLQSIRDTEDDWDLHLALGIAQQRNGQAALARVSFQKARDGIEKRLAAAPDNERAGYEAGLAEALVGLGETGAAARAAQEAVENLPHTAYPDVRDVHLTLALVYATMAQAKEAVAQLDDYLSQPGEWSIQSLARHPDFERIRDDPRFQALLKKYPLH
jgi:TolB-like protein/DNA-binding winged helix-turn-helix (wHTH) protein